VALDALEAGSARTDALMTLITGNPDPTSISTSYVERQNLTMRMGMRRFTRLTNGFSKKVENHAASIALHFVYMNFARPTKPCHPYPRTQAIASGHRGPHLDLRRDCGPTRLGTRPQGPGCRSWNVWTTCLHSISPRQRGPTTIPSA